MSYLKAYAVAMASLLAGATVVHHVFKPDLTIPLGHPSEGVSSVGPPAAQKTPN